MKKIKKYFINGIMLTCVSFLIRSVSVTFNVYISNKIGPAGMGLFSLISTVYAFSVTFATSGIGIAATRLTSIALAKNDQGELKDVMKKCFVYSLSFGISASVLLLILARPIGISLLGDERTVFPLKLLAITLPLIAVSSALNGYFTSVRRVYKNAAAQVFEQAVKICVCIYLLTYLVPGDVEAACTAVILSGVVAEILSFVFIFTEYLIDKRKHFCPCSHTHSESNIMRALVAIALPTAFSAYARSGLSAIEHILIPIGLELSGASRDLSLASYGIIQSMVLPIVLFPSAIISSFSGLLIPEVSECQANENHVEIRYIVSRVYQLALLFSIGVAGILICFSGELGLAIYNSTEAGRYIKLISPLVPIMYIDTASDALLKGLGKQVYTMNVNLIDSILGVLLVILLIPKYSINGYIAVIYICETVNAAMSIYKLVNETGFSPKPIRLVFAPLFCICGATSFTKIISYFIHIPVFSDKAQLFAAIGISLLLYMLFAMLVGCMSKDDIRWMKSAIKK